jgi:hypothetical protein
MNVNTFHLCVNCLAPGAMQCPVGHAGGTQRDPIRITIELCETCTDYLLNGDFVALREYGRDERVVKVKDNSG